MEHTPKTEWARPVVYFEIEAIDENVLIPFYKEMFNWDIGGGPIHRIPAGIGGPENGVAGHIRKGKRSGISLFIQVKNVERSLVQAVELGGAKTMDPYQIPGGALIAGITDPEGNSLTLVQQ
jgi:predicted enzyme related to lactoylglutathione lyase